MKTNWSQIDDYNPQDPFISKAHRFNHLFCYYIIYAPSNYLYEILYANSSKTLTISKLNKDKL